MAKLTHVTVVLLGVVGATAACSALIATGCSSSSSPGVGTDSGEDAQDDGGQSPDAKQDDGGKTKDAQDDGKSKADGEVADGSKADVVESDVVETDVLSDVVVSDAVVVDAPEDVTHADAGDAAADAPHDAAEDGGDAGTCTTTIAELSGGSGSDAGDAGDAGVAPQILFSFDGLSAVPAGWALDVSDPADGGDGPFTPTLSLTTTDGDTCPGALKTVAPFSGYAAQFVQTQYAYGASPANWTGHQTLHLNVKITVATAVDYAAINGVQPFVQSDSNFQYRAGAFVGGSTFSDGAFHSISVDLTPAPDAGAGNNGFDPTQVVQFGVQLLSEASAPLPGGPATAPTVTVILDDIWLQ
jgi:hypothetical protein